jgi:hypothetical protein
MDPALNHAECTIRSLRYREFLEEAERDRRAATAQSTSTTTRTIATTIRQQLGALLVSAGRRLQGSQTGAPESLGTIAARERGALA